MSNTMRQGVRGLYATYQSFLPALRDYAAADLGQGFTPVVRSRAIGPALGIRELYFKLETSNPSGSYKDRFAGLGLALAREAGARACMATSSGNTGAAIAAFCAALGMRAFVFVNERTPAGKLMQMQAHGARLFRVKHMGIDAAESALILQDLRAISVGRHIPLLISAFACSAEAMAGIKTIAYELNDQLGAVDHVFCPVGGGGLYTAIARGFADLGPAGHALPRIHPVQPELNDTVVTPLKDGKDKARTVPTTTAVSGLAVPFDLDGSTVIELARKCGGQGVLIGDQDALDAQAALMQQEGLMVEPAGAVSVAGLLQAAKQGSLKEHERVVCVLTGHGFKDPVSLEAAADRHPTQAIGRDELAQAMG